MWTPKIGKSKLNKLSPGVFASGMFLDGREDSFWVALKRDDGTWVIKYEHLPVESDWYSDDLGKERDSWEKREKARIARTGRSLNTISRVTRLVKPTDIEVMSLYRV